MSKTKVFIAAALALGVTSSATRAAAGTAAALPQAPNMTFFVTGAGPGKGADLGGIEGADQYCQTLAARHGAGGKTWRAYLEHPAGRRQARGQCARPHRQWPVAELQGQVVATNLDELHSDNNKLGFDNSLSERGQIIPGVGFAPNRHDVLTGSTAEGRAFPAGDDRTCRNWTSSTQGAAMVGHIDKKGLRDDAAVEVVEFVASLARAGRRLQPERSARHRRRRAVLLLRQQLKADLTTHCDRGRAGKARPRVSRSRRVRG